VTSARLSLSLWHDTLPAPPSDVDAHRPRLPGAADYDVVIVGAGFTGLWSAYYLAQHDPSLRIAVLEREFTGFGASGRNGGWVSGLLPMGYEQIAAESSRDAALAMQAAANDTVDEIARVIAAEGIDAGFHKGGYLRFATSPLQVQRIRDDIAHSRTWDQSEDDLRWLSRSEARERLAADGVHGAAYTPHCAAVHPAKLARALATVVERRGVKVFEGTPVTAIEPHAVRTPFGDVRAEYVVRATEAYTAEFDDFRREVLPAYSVMIATEPLPASFWEEVNWSNRETFNDDRRYLIYAQRTADDRIAIGGRGAPYRMGSRIRPEYEHVDRAFEAIHRSLIEFFPSLSEVPITHRWGGVLGFSRDFYPSVHCTHSTGLVTAGGYCGDGVALTNLAGRTVADLVTRTESDLVHLPWVGHVSPTWEREPLRWIGVNSVARLGAVADGIEARTGRPSRVVNAVFDHFAGH
jgi:glycine/D-amino acid oxidase-like deaminating enzyme